MSTADGRYTVVFNGEIFNFAEIRAELEDRGEVFRSRSDTEVLLQAYAAWGVEALRKFRGFFAFAIFDRHEGSLLLARDRLGIKPLYFTETPDGIVFSSEIRALLATGVISPRLSSRGVASYFTFGSVYEPDTILAGVSALEPGTWLRAERGRTIRGRYWALPVPSRPREATFDDTVERLRAELRNAVSMRLVADVPVGVFLSGGIDSSAVVALAAEASGGPVQTFNVSFDESEYDEDRYARAVAERFGCAHHVVHLPAARALAEIDQAVAALDQPSSDGINTYFVAKATREAGITVALSGLGGDELFAGYRNFRLFRRHARLRAIARLAPRNLSRFLIGERRCFHWRNRTTKALALLEAAGDVRRTYGVMRCMFTPLQRMRLLRESKPDGEFECVAVPPLDDGANGVDVVNAFSVLELSNYLRNTLLRDTDVMSMASALEVRVPLIDHRVVELALSIPGSLKIRNGGPNKALLAAAVPQLPESIVARKKMGFTLPFDRWFRGPLRGWVEERLFGSRMTALGIVDPDAVRALWSSFLRGEAYVSHARVWTLVVFAEWCERHGIREVSQ